MKWKNKGHEFDEFMTTFSEEFHKKIYVFGAGQLGEQMARCLDTLGLLGGIIDNSEKRQGDYILDHLIISLENYLSVHKKPAIVIAVSDKYANEIAVQLERNHMVHGKDFFYNYEFRHKILPLIYGYYQNKIYMELAQITLTEKCSLKCKKCAHACYNVSSASKDLSYLEACQSADKFFSKVDYINELVLIGGEPLLYRDLAKVIIYIGERYREKIGTLSITTNGTIVPNEEVLKASSKYQVLFRISNYAKTLPRLYEIHKRLISTLETYQIEYYLAQEDGYWIDYGFDYLNKDMDEIELTKTFNRCLTPCREVRGNKLYFCVMARSVSDNLHFNEGQDDYLDLDQLNDDNYKKILLEFNLGYSEKGYLDMCHRCHGMDAVNYPIPIAEQLV